MTDSGHFSDLSPTCPHYDLGPPDDDGVCICRECGIAISFKIPGGMNLAGAVLADVVTGAHTVIAEEGADVQIDP